MKIVPFEAVHLEMIRPQGAQLSMLPYYTPEYAKALEQTQAYSLVEGGEVLACAGVVELWRGRAMMWSLLSRDIGGRILKVHRATKRMLDAVPYDRIEIEVAVGFEQGHRWARMLGFELEAACMRKAFMDGCDAALYAKVK